MANHENSAGNGCFPFHQNQAPVSGNRYGGLVPKKKPLISKDNERAFFDSADWALCKQGAGLCNKSGVAVENLQPKLQRTPKPQLPPRRPACTSERGNLVYGNAGRIAIEGTIGKSLRREVYWQSKFEILQFIHCLQMLLLDFV